MNLTTKKGVVFFKQESDRDAAYRDIFSNYKDFVSDDGCIVSVYSFLKITKKQKNKICFTLTYRKICDIERNRAIEESFLIIKHTLCLCRMFGGKTESEIFYGV